MHQYVHCAQPDEWDQCVGVVCGQRARLLPPAHGVSVLFLPHCLTAVSVCVCVCVGVCQCGVWSACSATASCPWCFCLVSPSLCHCSKCVCVCVCVCVGVWSVCVQVGR